MIFHDWPLVWIAFCTVVSVCLFIVDWRRMKARHRREWDEMRARHFMERTEMELRHMEVRRAIDEYREHLRNGGWI